MLTAVDCLERLVSVALCGRAVPLFVFFNSFIISGICSEKSLWLIGKISFYKALDDKYNINFLSASSSLT